MHVDQIFDRELKDTHDPFRVALNRKAHRRHILRSASFANLHVRPEFGRQGAGLMLEIFTIADASRRVGCCVRTLHEWDRTGRFVARRNSIGHRFYTARDIAKLKRLRSTITVGRPWKAEARGDADAR